MIFDVLKIDTVKGSDSMKKVDIIGVQMDMGAGTRGVNMGPAAIRYAGLTDGIKALGMECLDKGDLIPMASGKTADNMRCYEQVNDINKKALSRSDEFSRKRRFSYSAGRRSQHRCRQHISHVQNIIRI